jgi:hypothetical protein
MRQNAHVVLPFLHSLGSSYFREWGSLFNLCGRAGGDWKSIVEQSPHLRRSIALPGGHPCRGFAGPAPRSTVFGEVNGLQTLGNFVQGGVAA